MKNLKQAGTSKLSELSIEELKAEKKKRTGILVSFSIILGLMIGTCVYVTIKKGVSSLTFMPIAFLPIFLIIWKSQIDVCNEIKSR
ncbi:hypothetical protein QWZ06_14895 [Chryseobacterium tructae]|uniref:FUSC family protein n=1 Tax=Chryseobacterium tructae TaxID=1037380 RepID=A0ABV7Y027_9FLAO|nr:hypothetical protein [Chryseobacterium tructae]MDN3693476.1 hypothetical protein [Chryseobacterium tructae]